MVNTGIIEIEDERKYKSDIGTKLAVAREAALKGSPEWPQLLRAGLTGVTTHPLPWQVSGRFRDWIIESTDNVKALQALWAEGNLSPNPPKDTDGRREDRGRGVRELQGGWLGLHYWGRWEVSGRSSAAAQGPYGRLRELGCGDGERIRSRELSRTGMTRV